MGIREKACTNFKWIYGLLKPDTPVVPYRLEMQAKLAAGGAKNLYEFWGGALAGELEREEKELEQKKSRKKSGKKSGRKPA